MIHSDMRVFQIKPICDVASEYSITGGSGQGVKLTTHLHLLLWLMHLIMPPFPHMVSHSNSFTFTFTFTFTFASSL
jgi:hypothetical protein